VSVDAAGSLAGFFAVWAVGATVIAIWQTRRFRTLDRAVGLREAGVEPNPSRLAAAAALRRMAERVAPSAPAGDSDAC